MVKKPLRTHWPAYQSRDPFRTFCGKIVRAKYLVPTGETITCASCRNKRNYFDAQRAQRPDIHPPA